MFKAYAKINLGLFVLERRPDGYHNIETVFHRIDLFDEIGLSKASSISIACSIESVPHDESNICFKAARLVQEHLHVPDGVRIEIVKNIPVGAGLGGGSSDAATVLRELPRFWNKSINESTLRDIALQLGSDVPFFLGKRSAIGRERGEQLEYFDLRIPYFILLCNPNIHVSTAWAYQHVMPAPHTTNLKRVLLDAIDDPPRLAAELRNDFEPAVFAEYPEVSGVKVTMLEGGAAYASMSGSGSSVYGLFKHEKDASAVGTILSSKGYRTSLTSPHFIQPNLTINS